MPAQEGARKTVSIVRDGVEVLFTVVNPITAWRANSVMSKEPGTVSWIEEFRSGDVFADIGANVGLYALCAARFRGVRTFAFEPESQNYAVLNENIYVNSLQDTVTGYCVALSDETRYDSLNLSKFEPGGSCHTFGANLDHQLQPMRPVFRQGCVATTLDTLVENAVLPVPNHIKIDVDGIEHKVIAGARKTLSDPAVRSVLVELNTLLDEHWGVVDTMLEHGFTYSEEEAARARRTSGPFAGTGNYVFRR